MYNLQKFGLLDKNSKYYTEPHVCYDKSTGDVGYNDLSELKKEPLTLEILTDGTITWTRKVTENLPGSLTRTITCSKNGGEFITYTASLSQTGTINVQAGDVLVFKNDSSGYGATNATSGIGGTAHFNARGNIMSTLSSNNFENLTSLPGIGNTFLYFFASSNLVDASKLVLPATTLVSDCYSNMFRQCSYLIAPPQLPALKLKSYCYNGMFAECIHLKYGPALPAVEIENGCYYAMFYGCTSLSEAPLLPSTYLCDYCYRSMFKGCSSLKYVKVMFTDNNGTNSLTEWLSGVSSSGTLVWNKHMSGGLSLPTGWTGQNSGTFDTAHARLHNSYVDTTIDIVNNTLTSIYCKFKGNSEGEIIGAEESSTTKRFGIHIGSEGKIQVRYVDYQGNLYDEWIGPVLDEGMHEVKAIITTSYPYIIIDGTSYSFRAGPVVSDASYDLFIHGTNRNGTEVVNVSENSIDIREIKLQGNSWLWTIKPISYYGIDAFSLSWGYHERILPIIKHTE